MKHETPICPIWIQIHRSRIAFGLSARVVDPLALADDAPANATDVGVPAAKPVKTQKIGAANKPVSKKAAVAAAPISPEREAAAIEFAQQNHAELVSLLPEPEAK